LIIISGFPCSGKSTRAAQLRDYFLSRGKSVHLISLPVDRDRVFASAAPEKSHRAAEFSAIKRALSKDAVVIVDGLNYIKGFRYQLFCEAKSCGTHHCVVHVAAPKEKCVEWNEKRRERNEYVGKDDEEPYDPEILDNLIFRYEEPNPMARWDSPCYVVPWFDEKILQLEEMYKTLFETKTAVKVNKSTAPKPVIEGDYLYELDKVTQDVVGLIMEHQRNSGGGGGTVPVKDCEVTLELPDRQLSLPQLQRLRRQFIQLNRTHQIARKRIRELFVEYINENLQL
ncbi:chromatin associated protein KTI12, partial [Ascodesmis nigricans]